MKAVEAERLRWLATGTKPRRVSRFERAATSWSDHTLADELAWVFGLVIVAATAAEVAIPNEYTLGRLGLIAKLFAVLAALGLVWLLTPPGRRHLTDARKAARIARYIDVQITRHFDDIVTVKAGFSPDSVHLDGVTIGEMVDDPKAGTDKPGTSVLPTGRKPKTITLTVSTALDADKVADGYAKAFGYAYADVISDDLAAGQYNIELHIYARPIARGIDPTDLPDFAAAIMHELNLGDTRRQLPTIKPGSVITSGNTEAVSLSDGVLAVRHERLELAIVPTPQQVDGNVHDGIIKAVRDFLGYAEAEAEEWYPGEGIKVVLYRDGKPPLTPTTLDGLRVNWAEIAPTIGLPGWDLIDVQGEGTAPEPVLTNGLTAAPSILTERFERVTFQFVPPVDGRGNIGALQRSLNYHKLQRNEQAATTAGLVYTASRDPLLMGKVIDLELVGKAEAMIVGDEYGGRQLWHYLTRTSLAISGQSGTGKGDLLQQLVAWALALDVLSIFYNPKEHSDLVAYSGGMVNVETVAQGDAALRLGIIEMRLRNWKIRQAALGVGIDGVMRNVRDRDEYADLSRLTVEMGNPPLPELGGLFMMAMDETNEWLNPALAKAARKAKQDTLAAVYDRLRSSVGSFAALSRSTGGLLVAATQVPRIESFGGGVVLNNFLDRVLFKVNDGPSFVQMLGTTTPEQKEALRTGNGKGHNLHTTKDRGVQEGQTFWIPANISQILAEHVVSGYTSRNPGVPLDRDFVAELAYANQIFGEKSKTFDHVDHAEHPYALGPIPITGPVHLAAEAHQAAAAIDELEATGDIEAALADLPSRGDDGGLLDGIPGEDGE